MNEEIIKDEANTVETEVEETTVIDEELDSEEELEIEEPIDDKDFEELENVEELLDEEELLEDEPIDKKERAIIKYKKEAKAKEREAEELRNRLLEHEKKDRMEELKAEGKTPQEALRTATEEIETKQLRYELDRAKIKDLESKYSGISLYTNEIIKLKEKFPEFSYEEIYKAKFSKGTDYDVKTKAEAIARKTKSNASLEKATPKNKKGFSMPRELESSYEIWKKVNPNGTKKEYMEDLSLS